MSVIDVRRERDIVLVPSFSNGTSKEGEGRQGSSPADLEGKINIDCGRDRGLDWVLDDEDGREVWLTILDAIVLEMGFRSGSTAGEANLGEVESLSVIEDWKDGPTGDEDLGSLVTPLGVSSPEGRSEDLLAPGSDLFRLSLSE